MTLNELKLRLRALLSARYSGIKVNQRVVVGRSSDPDAVTVDAVTGATVTVNRQGEPRQ